MTEYPYAFSLDDVTALVAQVRAARLDELEAIQALGDKEAELEKQAALVVMAAYDNGLIDGKNKDTREAGEKAALARSKTVVELQAQVTKLAQERELYKINRQAAEDQLSLTKAWLYSLAGGP